MADENTSTSNDRVNLVYETKVGDKSEQIELPFKLLVLGDYTRDERSQYLDEQTPILLNAESSSLEVLFKQLKPELKLKVANKLEDDDSDLLIELTFNSLDDFTPSRIIEQHAGLKKIVEFTDTLGRSTDSITIDLSDADKSLIESVLQVESVSLAELQQSTESLGWLISSIENRLCEQLDEILHHPHFNALESVWRALDFLIERTDFSENCEIAVLNVSKQALADDFEDMPEITQSRYYQLVYTDEFGQFGGRPYGAIIAAYELNPKASDMKLIQKIAGVSAVAHAPFIAGAAAEFFDIDSYSKFSRLRDLSSIFNQPAYIKWNSFQQSDDSRYVGLTLPSFLLRESYQIEIGSLLYNEKIRDKETELVWGNSSFAFATRLLDSFAQYRWCLNCTGQAAGQVQGLNMKEGRISTQFILTDRRESEVVKQGFIPLSVHKGEDTAAFYSAYSTHRVDTNDEQDAEDLSSRLSAQIPYLMIISRISQYLKVMQRENLGSWRNRRDLDQQLNKWLLKYVSDMDNPAAGVRARRPLRRAEIKVREVEGKPDWFVTQIQITPHLKFMGSSFVLTENSKMEKN